MKTSRTIAYLALAAALAIPAITLRSGRLAWGQTAATRPVTQTATAPAESPEVTAQRLAILKPETKKPVSSEVIDVAKLVARSSGVGTRRDLFDGPTVTLNNMEGHISTLNPGEESHPPHQHVNEEMVILIEGTLEVSINGKIQNAAKGDVMFFSSNDWHNVKNIGAAPALYYVLNWSAPAKPGTTTAPATAPAGK